MNKIKKTKLLLVLSCGMLVTSIGYSTWIGATTKEFVVNNQDKKTKPVAYIVGNEKVKFATIEKALDNAVSGDIVCVIPPSSGSVSYEITRDCVIKEGVTLVMPISESSFSSVTDQSTLNEYIKGMIEVPDGPGTTSKATAKNLKTTITVKENVKVENRGDIVVAGILTGGNNNAGSIGQTSGDYCKINLSSGAKIIQKGSESANLYCFGFVDEETDNNNSEICIESGSIYLPFVVNDYRGFGYSYALSQKGGISDYGCSPFNRYEFPNVSSLITISETGNVKGIVNILVSFSSAGVSNSVSHETLNMVGKSSDNFICLLENSILKYKYNKGTGLSNLEIVDGCTVGNLAFKATVSGFSADMNTASGYFPVSYNFSIKLSSSSESTKAAYNSSKQKFKFLPGSSLEVGPNCELSFAETAIYSAFVDGSIGNGKEYSHGANSTAYPVKRGAVFKLDSTSTLSAKALGGVIYCDSTSNITCNTSSTICNEPWSIGGGLVPSFTEYLEIREALNIVPINNLSKKKVYFFSNTFKKYNSLLPKTQVLINQNISNTIEGNQSVLFFDEINDCQLIFEKNIYNSLYLSNFASGKLTVYPYQQEIQATDDDILIGVINSTVSISSSNNNVNEFEVQSITITSAQDKIDGKDPLYPGKTLGLKADLVDSTKIYNPTISWSTSDSSIARVDSTGVVTGVQLGKVTIYAECGGKKASYETEVIEENTIVEVTNMWLESTNGKKSNDFKGTDNTIGTANDGSKDFKYHEKVTSTTTVQVSLKVEPEDATITGIQWTFASWGQKSYMTSVTATDKKYYKVTDGALGGENDTSNKTISIVFEGSTGQYPDSDTIKCTVFYGDDKSYDLEFVFDYDYACVLPTALVLMADGSYREAGTLNVGDEVMCFNHETGRMIPNKLIINSHIDEEPGLYDVVNLEFENNKKTSLVDEHAYFDVEENKYIYLNKDNATKYIGHRFVFIDHELKRYTLKLKHVSVEKLFTKLAAPVTAYHLNVIVDDMLSIEGGIAGLFNVFEYDRDTLAYDKESMEEDLQRYGLTDYDQFKDYFPYEVFHDFLPCKYFNVACGKGIVTWDIIKSYISKWKDQLMENMKG